VSSAAPTIFGSAARLMTTGAGASTVRPVRRIGLQTVDYVVAGVATASLELETWLGASAEGHRVAVGALGPLITAGVALRRRYPTVAGVGAGLLAVLMQSVWPSQSLSFGVAWMCDLYALAVWSSPRRFRLGLSAYTAAGLAVVPFDPKPSASAFFIVVSTIVIVLVHTVVGERDRRARVAERERDLVAREAVVEERARIARELHDAIAHNVSMMVLQAGAERRVLDGEQSSTREVLETVERTGRGALTEMRRLVGMLRSDEAEPLTPQPGLDDLPRLITQVREAGLPVELEVDGERRELPVGLELSAYRIVQEALTNALKHAGDAHATVRVRYGAESLELEIVDDGPGGTTRAAGGGHGLVGMRERVALYGGRFEASRRPAGGFTVRALLPIR
jgi:signal transduction histidine kinase